MICLLQLVFEGIRGTTFSSDIAIDDFKVTSGPCAAPASCNFEKDLCGFTNVVGDQFDWTRDNGGTPSSTTGPHNDHTTNSAAGTSLIYSCIYSLLYYLTGIFFDKFCWVIK